MWQAKHGKKVYGNFVDPYEAACELARQLGREPPVENFQHTLVALYMRIPLERLAAECERALAEVERLRAEGGGGEEKAPPPPIRKLTPAEMTRHARMGAIKIWWHHLWTSGQTFHLNVQRGMLFVEFEKYEKTRLGKGLPKYAPMVDGVFLKLLKAIIGKTTAEVKSSIFPHPFMWVIDADTSCPPELRKQWEAEKTRRAEVARQREQQLAAQKAEEEQRAAEEAAEAKRVEDAELEERRAKASAWVDDGQHARDHPCLAAQQTSRMMLEITREYRRSMRQESDSPDEDEDVDEDEEDEEDDDDEEGDHRDW